MNCPKCLNRTDVINSRDRENYTYRARICPVCGYKFTTHEIVHGPTRKYKRKAVSNSKK